jgi:hypothetical protein
VKVLLVHTVHEFGKKPVFDPTVRHRKLIKGFIRNGHDVMEFSYFDMLSQLCPTRIRPLKTVLGKPTVTRALMKLAEEYSPDMVVLFGLRRLDEETVLRLRRAAGRAVFVGMYADMTSGPDERVVRIARQCDWLMLTSAGQALQWYKRAGVPKCAFVPNAADADIEGPGDVPDAWRSEVVFTGKLAHNLPGQDAERESLIRRLADRRLTVWGCLGRPRVVGADYSRAIRGAKIALSINAYNDVRMYHSDRLTNYLAHGAFVLAKYVPGSELMFEDRRHLRYFETSDQCVELIEGYLADDEERRRIAASGMERVHSAFNCARIARAVAEIATAGTCGESWAEIV